MPELRRLFHELIRFETELWNAADAHMRSAHGLPLAHFEPMRLIGDREDCRVNDIARELAITVGGASKLIDRIAASGHCRRRPNPGDRRSSLLTLTPSGDRLLGEAAAGFDAVLETWLGAALTPAAVDELTQTLMRLRAAGRRAAGAGAPVA